MLSVSLAYRRSADAIGATQRPWNVIVALPFVMVALNLLARFFTTAAGDSYLTVIGVGNMALLGLLVLAVYQAMSAFDRACAGRQMSHADRCEVPAMRRLLG